MTFINQTNTAMKMALYGLFWTNFFMKPSTRKNGTNSFRKTNFPGSLHEKSNDLWDVWHHTLHEMPYYAYVTVGIWMFLTLQHLIINAKSIPALNFFRCLMTILQKLTQALKNASDEKTTLSNWKMQAGDEVYGYAEDSGFKEDLFWTIIFITATVP